MRVESKEIGWFESAILSQSRLESDNNVLIGKGFDHVHGRGDIDQGTTTEEKPMHVKPWLSRWERS